MVAEPSSQSTSRWWCGSCFSLGTNDFGRMEKNFFKKHRGQKRICLNEVWSQNILVTLLTKIGKARIYQEIIKLIRFAQFFGCQQTLHPGVTRRSFTSKSIDLFLTLRTRTIHEENFDTAPDLNFNIFHLLAQLGFFCKDSVKKFMLIPYKNI